MPVSGPAVLHRDHPRSRGEYVIGNLGRGTLSGSSPLSRGIRGPGCSRYRRRGIIPALAGNTTPSTTSPSWWRDHPRSRGEYLSTLRRNSCVIGSSPLSRGIHAVPGPAVPSDADHPRSRGEYDIPLSSAYGYNGSSPLSRGIPPSQSELGDQQRIIPALAGNTPGVILAGASMGDHPRSRGEYYWHTGKNKLCIGSSPLSRGIRSGMGCGLAG